jgi:hypothetical protein
MGRQRRCFEVVVVASASTVRKNRVLYTRSPRAEGGNMYGLYHMVSAFLGGCLAPFCGPNPAFGERVVSGLCAPLLEPSFWRGHGPGSELAALFAKQQESGRRWKA